MEGCGVAAIVGCTNPKVPQDFTHMTLAKELIKRDVLVLTTGCATIACSKQGLTNPKKALELTGPGLREVCEEVGIPPVLTCGRNRLPKKQYRLGTTLWPAVCWLFSARNFCRYQAAKTSAIIYSMELKKIWAVVGRLHPTLSRQLR